MLGNLLTACFGGNTAGLYLKLRDYKQQRTLRKRWYAPLPKRKKGAALRQRPRLAAYGLDESELRMAYLVIFAVLASRPGCVSTTPIHFRARRSTALASLQQLEARPTARIVTRYVHADNGGPAACCSAGGDCYAIHGPADSV